MKQSFHVCNLKQSAFCESFSSTPSVLKYATEGVLYLTVLYKVGSYMFRFFSGFLHMKGTVANYFGQTEMNWMHVNIPLAFTL